jgi:protein-S-isoprenylcysteine O-methyltransferase Ste14
MEPQKLKELKKQVLIRFGLAVLIIPVILYALAGTLLYWQGWLYWVVLVIPVLGAVLHFLKTDPELLERRMKYKEQEKEQQIIIFLASIALAAGFLVVGYDLRRHGLDQLSPVVILAADAGIFLGYCLIIWVMKVNSYAARTIEVEVDQLVITTGPYSIVRHPMYLGSLAMILLTPIALGSWRAAPVFMLYIPLIVWRIVNEEKVLLRDLPGYREYCRKRRYRLLPFVW